MTCQRGVVDGLLSECFRLQREREIEREAQHKAATEQRVRYLWKGLLVLRLLTKCSEDTAVSIFVFGVQRRYVLYYSFFLCVLPVGADKTHGLVVQWTTGRRTRSVVIGTAVCLAFATCVLPE